MRTTAIIGVLALGLSGAAGCSSSSNPTDARLDGGRKDHRADLLGQLDTGPTVDARRDGTGTASCPSTVAAATALTAGTPGTEVKGKIDDPSKSACYYKLDGKKGDKLWILTTAKTGTDAFDPTYVDTVVVLLDSTQTQIAYNDDPENGLTNDAEIFTMLPADGTYTLRVSDCNNAPGVHTCSPASGITTKDFSISLQTLDYPWAVGETAEPNDTQAGAAALPYLAASTGKGYLPSIAYGFFEKPDDVDVFTINLPADTPVPGGGRAAGEVSAFRWGTNGNGSTAPLGKMWIVDPADATHHLAEFDATVGTTPGSLYPPLKVNTPYYLYVSRGSGTAGNNEFYYVQHFAAGVNPLEEDESGGAKNDTVLTAAVLSTSASDANAYYIEGDLSPAADVDYFWAPIPTGLTDKTVSVSCGAQREGSGLRGLKATLFKSDGATLLTADATGTETAADTVLLKQLALGSETTKVVLKLEATASHDANVTSSFYRCGVHFR